MNKEQAAEILGIDIDASLDEAKAARNELMKANHPDKGGDKKFAEQINTAFETWKKYNSLALSTTSQFRGQISVVEKMEFLVDKWTEFEKWFDDNIISPIEHAGKRSNMIEMKTEMLEFLKTGKEPSVDNISMFIAEKGIINIQNNRFKAQIWMNMIDRFIKAVSKK